MTLTRVAVVQPANQACVSSGRHTVPSRSGSELNALFADARISIWAEPPTSVVIDEGSMPTPTTSSTCALIPAGTSIPRAIRDLPPPRASWHAGQPSYVSRQDPPPPRSDTSAPPAIAGER